MISLAGTGDYSLSFNYKNYPEEMLKAWKKARPEIQLRFSTLSDWYGSVKMDLDRRKSTLKTVKSGSRACGWQAFWVNAPLMKQWYRRVEHLLQSAEALTTIASLSMRTTYPSQDFSNAWVLMALNMDRNLLWGAAVQDAFAHEKGWDARDRFHLWGTCDWMSGKGRQRFHYAVVAHQSPWEQAQIPQLAWDFNCPPIVVGNFGGFPLALFWKLPAMSSSRHCVELAMKLSCAWWNAQEGVAR